jgi:hypothetical protein
MSLKHSLTNIDSDALVGDCAVCGPSVRIKAAQKQKLNQKQYYRCYHKYLVTKTHIETPWKFHKKDYCETCGFEAVHECQLTIDHIDGNRYNNQISNWQTLCHNCHALKTLLNKDHFNRYSSPLKDAETSLS